MGWIRIKLVDGGDAIVEASRIEAVDFTDGQPNATIYLASGGIFDIHHTAEEIAALLQDGVSDSLATLLGVRRSREEWTEHFRQEAHAKIAGAAPAPPKPGKTVGVGGAIPIERLAGTHPSPPSAVNVRELVTQAVEQDVVIRERLLANIKARAAEIGRDESGPDLWPLRDRLREGKLDLQDLVRLALLLDTTPEELLRSVPVQEAQR